MLTNKTIAFIGGGNMAQALLKGLLDFGVVAGNIKVCEPNLQKQKQIIQQYAVTVSGNSADVVTGVDAVLIAVKPGVVPLVLAEIAPLLDKDTLIISIAAGVSMATIAGELKSGQPIVRVMPNTPALIGAGISVIYADKELQEAKLELARQIMAAVGDVDEVADEALLDGVTALSGSGPAYIYLIAEALSDGGVSCGLPRPLADKLAVKTLIGSARLIEESGEHPAVLKNQVTSPGGTTIAAVAQLERSGLRSALIDGVRAAWQRSVELSKQS
ncbi:MAG: pyrroline-5-carboxylate reductase [Magnetococcales bacterium]|nr:pyrroline-5-carboxylate reductase [Magnetococcales bacterium]